MQICCGDPFFFFYFYFFSTFTLGTICIDNLLHRIRDKLDTKIDKKLENARGDWLLSVQKENDETAFKIRKDFNVAFEEEKDNWADKLRQLEQSHAEQVDKLKESFERNVDDLKGNHIQPFHHYKCSTFDTMQANGSKSAPTLRLRSTLWRMSTRNICRARPPDCILMHKPGLLMRCVQPQPPFANVVTDTMSIVREGSVQEGSGD